MASVDWTPVLSADGLVYCSPRCGFKCKKADYDVAVIEGDTLAARMGDGWEPLIQESGGRWHVSVTKGETKISVHHDYRQHPPGPTTYMAWIEPGVLIRQQTVQFIESADNPEDALGFATQSARTTISRIEAALADILK